ncbi:MAG: hypothetical protein H6816_03870 [Phycisphaerales bacterium]|nr:hypothetical protein [Phycisphaerales bacterium]
MSILLLALICAQPPAALTAVRQVELDQLAARVATDLRNPVEYRFHEDKQAERFGYALRLATVWPRPESREPLLAILASDDLPKIGTAAIGLLNYDDPAISAKVAQMTDDDRLFFAGCLGERVGDSVARAIKRHTEGFEFPIVAGRLLPEENTKSSPADAPGIMTVPRAIAALRDDELTIRLQAFVWLMRFGIVLDVQPLLEAWPQMTDAEREQSIGYSDEAPSIGAESLRRALEHVLESDPPKGPKASALLVHRLAWLSSDHAHDAAVALLTQWPHAPVPVERSFLNQWSYALRGLIRVSQPADAELAYGWIAGSFEPLRHGGFGMLAAMDDERAVETVIAYMEDSSEPRPILTLVNPIDILASREWPDNEVHWRYIRAIQGMLNRPDDPGRRNYKCGYPTSALIDTANAMTQVYHGDNGVMIPSGTNQIEVARTIRQFNGWVEEHDPRRMPRLRTPSTE